MAPVLGDRVQLQQVVLNLILNAVEAMSSVEAGERELLISTDQSEANVARSVAVCDSGPGIDPKHSELVLEAFLQHEIRRNGDGSVNLTRSIITAHGGRLWAAAGRSPEALYFNLRCPAQKRSRQSPGRSLRRKAARSHRSNCFSSTGFRR